MSSRLTSVEAFREACALIPSDLAQASALPPPIELGPISALLRRGKVVDVAGVGGSEGPARHLVAILNEIGVSASYQPLTVFLEPRATVERVLVLFSQGLSPNARIAVGRAREYAAALLVTDPSRSEEQVRDEFIRDGGQICDLRVRGEPRALVRLTGPTLFRARAVALGLELCARLGREPPVWAASFSGLSSAYRAAQAQGRALSRGALNGCSVRALVLVDPISELAQSEASKWREAFWRDPPPVFDALAFAHGPLQSLPDGDDPILVVRGATESSEGLAARVRLCLERARKPSVEVRLTLPPPLSPFELDAIMNEIIVDRMSAHPEEWPGRGWDDPLYSLDAPRDVEGLGA